MRRLAAAAFVAALLAPLAAAAQGPAAVRGAVYDCASGAPIAGASVELRNVDSGATLRFLAGDDGRFVRVGLEPGRYVISARGPVPAGPRASTLPPPMASRLARLENDDVLDMRIGTYRTADATAPPPGPHEVRGVCDNALVPPAPSTFTRYIVH